MTGVDSGPRPVDALATQPAGRRRRWLFIGGVVLLTVAGLAIGLGWRWLYSAHALRDGAGYRWGAPRQLVGRAVYSPAMVLSDGSKAVSVDVRSVTPRVVQNTAKARIRVLICRRNDAISHLGSDDLSFCSRAKPFVPGKLRIGTDDAGNDSIILAITPTHLGRLTIDGVHVTYRQGVRHGSQNTGGDLEIGAAPPAPPAPAVTQPPTITAVTPTGGTAAGGTRIEIAGTNFTDTATVRFGSVDLTGKEVSVVSPKSLVVLAPAHAAGTVDVRVVTSRGVSPVVAADRYTYR